MVTVYSINLQMAAIVLFAVSGSGKENDVCNELCRPHIRYITTANLELRQTATPLMKPHCVLLCHVVLIKHVGIVFAQ